MTSMQALAPSPSISCSPAPASSLSSLMCQRTADARSTRLPKRAKIAATAPAAFFATPAAYDVRPLHLLNAADAASTQTCHKCGMLFNASHAEDAAVHKSFHRSFDAALTYRKWKDEDHYRVGPLEQRDGGFVLRVRSSDARHHAKVDAIRAVIDRQLGYVESAAQHVGNAFDYYVYLYVLDGTIVACAFAEPVSQAFRVIPRVIPPVASAATSALSSTALLSSSSPSSSAPSSSSPPSTSSQMSSPQPPSLSSSSSECSMSLSPRRCQRPSSTSLPSTTGSPSASSSSSSSSAPASTCLLSSPSSFSSPESAVLPSFCSSSTHNRFLHANGNGTAAVRSSSAVPLVQHHSSQYRNAGHRQSEPCFSELSLSACSYYAGSGSTASSSTSELVAPEPSSSASANLFLSTNSCDAPVRSSPLFLSSQQASPFSTTTPSSLLSPSSATLSSSSSSSSATTTTTTTTTATATATAVNNNATLAVDLNDEDDVLACQTEADSSALIGVSRLWVASSYRRRGIATRLMDAVCCNWLSHRVSRERVAFSPTTRDGRRFARHYVGRADYLVYK